MAYENELFFGSLVALVGFLAYRFAPHVRALLDRKPLPLNATAAAATGDAHVPASPSTWALSTHELVVCGALLALALLSFVLLTKKSRLLREQRRRAKAQAAAQEAAAQAPFVCTVPSRDDYEKDPELRVPLLRRVRWPMLVYLGGLHALGAYWVVHVALGADTTRAATYALGFFLYAVGGLGITAGAHRLFSHRSYKAAWPLRALLMLMVSVANQGSAIHWSRDHRTHHLFSDTMSDPYDASRGVFFSHVGWLLLRKHSRVLQASRRFVSVADLWADPLLALQEKLDPWWNLTWCFVLPTLVPMALWGEGAWNAYMVCGVIKYLMTLHVTWSVNSIVHKWGRKPYNRPPAALALEPVATQTLSGPLPMTREDTTTESPIVSLIALGEGWHSWHHAFCWDYATSELEPYQQWNPTKLFIDACAALGLVTGRRRATGCWALRKQKWLDEARAAGRVSSRVELRERLVGWPLFRMRQLDVLDPPPEAAPAVAPPS